MIRLYDNETDADLGTISEEQLEFLVEELVEESLDECTYNINPGVIGGLEAHGGDPQLITLLRRALGTRTSMELLYEPD
jgi:processive 1,2-diacylglycerol beta-glucosyltransferase